MNSEFLHKTQLRGESIDTSEQPLRSIGNPETGTCSLAPDIAFVTILSNFIGANLKLWIGFVSEICDELLKSVKDFLLLPKLKLIVLIFETFCDAGMHCLVACICKPGVVFAAISDKEESEGIIDGQCNEISFNQENIYYNTLTSNPNV